MSQGVRFVHAADLHLDAPFSGVSADDARVGAALADATFAAFDRVIDTCLERDAQFLVIAGDAYNAADSSLRAQLHFQAGMQRLADAGIDVFVVHGNHDPANGWSAGLPLPESVRVFPTDRVGRFEVEVAGEVVAAVYGRSFARAAELENFALGYARQPGDAVAVGVLHANIGSAAGYDPYAPASLDDLRAARMDYWALGHIHKQEILARDPWVVYPGSTQGLNPKETGAHGCMVVELSADRRQQRGGRRDRTNRLGAARLRHLAGWQHRGRPQGCSARRASRSGPSRIGRWWCGSLLWDVHPRTANSLARACSPNSSRTCATINHSAPVGVARPRHRRDLGSPRPRCSEGRGRVLGRVGEGHRRACR